MLHRIRVLELVLVFALLWPAAALRAAPALEEYALGADGAPVTMIEFSSLTCPHCADFHVETLPKIKDAYIEPGKLRLVYRDFPLDPLAAAAAMLPHCAGPDRYFGLLGTLFRSQAMWARSEDPARELERIARFAGLSPTQFADCLNDSELLLAIQQRADAARQQYNITSTPTFVINGQKIVGAQGFEAFQRVIEEQLQAGDDAGPDSGPNTEELAAWQSGEDAGWLARQWDRLRSWWNGAAGG